MVYLNKIVSVNISKLELIILEKIDKQIENELYYINDIKNEAKENIKKNILKEIKNEIKNDNFIYRIMADNKCTYKHKNGKKDGYFCHNNITNNGDSKKYLCRTHNRNHIPKKREKHNISNKNGLDPLISKSIESIKNNINSDAISTDKSNNNYSKNVLSLKVKSLNNNIDNSIFRKKFNFYKYYYILNKNYNEKVKENGNHLILDSKKEERTILYNYYNNIKIISSIGKYNPIDVF